MNTTSRRGFLTTSFRAGAVLGGLGLTGVRPALAIEPFKRTGASRFRLSLAAYSFRQYFKVGKGAGIAPPEKQIDLFQFIDYCADHGCDAAELTSYYFPANTDADYLVRIKRHAFMRGVAISGTAVGNTFTLPTGERRDREIVLVKKWIDYAQIMGAPHVRVFAGETPAGVSPAQAKASCIGAIEECCAYGADKGVFLSLENHGGIVAGPDGLLEIVHAVKSPWLGINLDSANFHTDDVYADFARCVPYAINVQVKSEVQARGQRMQPADLPRFVKILRDAGYQGYVALEYESAEDPQTAVPPLLKQLKALLAA